MFVNGWMSEEVFEIEKVGEGKKGGGGVTIVMEGWKDGRSKQGRMMRCGCGWRIWIDVHERMIMERRDRQ